MVIIIHTYIYYETQHGLGMNLVINSGYNLGCCFRGIALMFYSSNMGILSDDK
jgi:hypothetical protein